MSLDDAASISDGAVVEADVCIVGAGAAGLALAVELDGGGARTVVLESGGLSFEPEIQELAEFENVGAPLRVEEPVRRLQFGGTTNAWYGRLALLDGIDFERREGVPSSGWPISESTVLDYVPRAARFLGLARPDALQPRFWATDAAFRRLELTSLAPGIHLWPPDGQIGRAQLPRLRRSRTVRVILHAQASRLVADREGRSISSLGARGLAGNPFDVKARAYVLACGGLENARVLLLSRDREGCGVGNRHDAVGRYYLNHPRGDDLARLYLNQAGARNPALIRALSEHRDARVGGRVQFCLRPADGLQRQERLLNCCSFLYPVRPPRVQRLGETLRSVRSSCAGHDIPRRSELALLGSELPLLARLAAERLAGRPLPLDHFVLIDQVEQVPDPESRVTLGEGRDRFGDPVLRLHWTIGDETTRTSGACTS